MPIWDRDGETEWEKYQRTRGKQERRTPEAREAEDPPPPGEEKRPLVERLWERVRLPEDPREEPEVCPRCGGEMEPGYLVGRNGITWTDRKPGVLLGTLNSENSFLLTGPGLLSAYVPAWYCPKCRKITVDVPESDELPEAIRRTMTQADLEAAAAQAAEREKEGAE